MAGFVQKWQQQYHAYHKYFEICCRCHVHAIKLHMLTDKSLWFGFDLLSLWKFPVPFCWHSTLFFNTALLPIQLSTAFYFKNIAVNALLFAFVMTKQQIADSIFLKCCGVFFPLLTFWSIPYHRHWLYHEIELNIPF